MRRGLGRRTTRRVVYLKAATICGWCGSIWFGNTILNKGKGRVWNHILIRRNARLHATVTDRGLGSRTTRKVIYLEAATHCRWGGSIWLGNTNLKNIYATWHYSSRLPCIYQVHCFIFPLDIIAIHFHYPYGWPCNFQGLCKWWCIIYFNYAREEQAIHYPLCCTLNSVNSTLAVRSGKIVSSQLSQARVLLQFGYWK